MNDESDKTTKPLDENWLAGEPEKISEEGIEMHSLNQTISSFTLPKEFLEAKDWTTESPDSNAQGEEEKTGKWEMPPPVFRVSSGIVPNKSDWKKPEIAAAVSVAPPETLAAASELAVSVQSEPVQKTEPPTPESETPIPVAPPIEPAPIEPAAVKPATAPPLIKAVEPTSVKTKNKTEKMLFGVVGILLMVLIAIAISIGVYFMYFYR